MLNEPILSDEYPVYADYLYVADGKVYRSDWHNLSVRELKGREGFSEVRRCDMIGRGFLKEKPKLAEPLYEIMVENRVNRKGKKKGKPRLKNFS